MMLQMDNFNIPVTTDSPDCQLWVNRGVLCVYGLQREEAIRRFEKALSFDKNCAMAHYFIAYSLAADYNNPNGMDYSAGFKEAEMAVNLAKSSSIMKWEKALIEAQVHRFCWPVGSKTLKELHKNYANAMRPVYQEFGQDHVDVCRVLNDASSMESVDITS